MITQCIIIETTIVVGSCKLLSSTCRHLKSGLASWVGTELKEWVLEHPGQVVLTVVSALHPSLLLTIHSSLYLTLHFSLLFTCSLLLLLRFIYALLVVYLF